MSLFWGTITIVSCLASLVGVYAACKAKNAAIDAKIAVQNARDGYAKSQDTEELNKICNLAMEIQKKFIKYSTKEKQGIKPSEVEKDTNSLGEFITTLNNESNLIKNEVEPKVNGICKKLKKHLESFRNKDSENINAAKQISSIIDDFVSKIKKIVKENNLAKIK